MGLIFHNLIKFQDADDIIRKNMKVLEDYEEIRLSEASGRISAEDVYSRNNLPLFSRSQVDGYAILASAPTGITPPVGTFMHFPCPGKFTAFSPMFVSQFSALATASAPSGIIVNKNSIL